MALLVFDGEAAAISLKNTLENAALKNVRNAVFVLVYETSETGQGWSNIFEKTARGSGKFFVH